MHVKSFLAGTVAGAILISFPVWLAHETDSPNADSVDKFEDIALDKNALNSQSTSSTQPADTPGTLIASKDKAGTSALESAATNVADSSDGTGFGSNAGFRPNSVPISDTHKPLFPRQGVPDKTSGDVVDLHAALEAESKDDGWAYFMEQAIQQFLATHPQSIEFEISNIVCRSTMCELQVIGFDESAGPSWSKIMFDLRNQPWSNFGQTGSSSSTVDGRLAIVSFLQRMDKEN